MTHILLVDDEPLVLVGIQSMLKWEDYDAEVVGTARNGLQALELIEKLRPELVITDIKMPSMNGLQLMEAAQKRYGTQPAFLILTSYEEYAFVKEAIDRQAVGYLIKLDLTEQSLLDALRKAQERISTLNHDSTLSRYPPAKRFGMQPFYDRFFIRLFNNLFENEEQFKLQRKELGVDFSFEAYAVCYCELPELAAQGMGQERLMSLYSSTTHMAWETVTRFMACYITPLDTRHFNVTFCLSEQEVPIYQKVVREVLEKVVQVVYNYFSVRLVCCVGCKVTHPMELSESYYTARLCLTDRSPEDCVVFYDGEARSVDAANVFDIALYRKQLIRAFEEQDANELEQIMNRIIDSIRAHPARRLQAMDAACNLLFLCLSQFNDGEEIVSHIFDQELEGYRCIYRQRGIPEIVSWMCTLRDGLLKALHEQRRGYKNQIIVQIKAYIQANLNQRLNLQNVAAVFGFSPNYLSTLFAKQAECPFVEYVTREKIRAAKEMMREENVKLYEIAERLGFDNAFYFSKVFRRSRAVPRGNMYSGAARGERIDGPPVRQGAGPGNGERGARSMVFQVERPDYGRSPFTGMTRRHWIEAGEYLLSGIFQHILSFDDPVVVPRQETAVTYPHSAGALWEQKAEYFEGLARSFLIAAPLIHDRPELKLCGYSLREYYKAHVLRSCTRGDPQCVGHYDELAAMAGGPYRTFQQTVETCALVTCLRTCREEIWDTYSREERDRIADFLLPYAHGYTVPQNWRLFNMLDLAFLKGEGYPIDEDIMLEHTQAILDYYAGDGWYRDGHSFDYYSCWAFNVYAPLWNLWYGYEHLPCIAQRFEDISNELAGTYPDFFDRDGSTNMWGRSSIYRCAAASALAGNLLLPHSAADPGLARRIASGSLLQFLTREDFLWRGIPTLGFYRQFSPLVQGYSCAESPFWLGKAFLCLHLPEDHPFWTARENNGTWELLGRSEVKTTVLDGPALCFSNHQANGETILRTGKVVKQTGDEHGMWNYAKLCYNTKYPWEAKPSELVEAQQYVLRDLSDGSVEKANVTLWSGERDGVLYRRQFFNYRLDVECHWLNALDLADFTVPYGVLRVDKLRLYGHPASLTLGAYGFPDNGTRIIRLEEGGAKAIVLKGHDAVGREKQLAMTLYDGWERLELLHSQGTNPDSERSIVVYGETARQELYRNGPYILISQVMTKESLEDFTADEIFPIRSVEYSDPKKWGGFGPVTLTMKDGQRRVVEFGGLEGRLQI